MKLISKATGKTVAEITTNHSMSLEDVISLMGWTVDDDGDIYDGKTCVANYDDLDMIY